MLMSVPFRMMGSEISLEIFTSKKAFYHLLGKYLSLGGKMTCKVFITHRDKIACACVHETWQNDML